MSALPPLTSAEPPVAAARPGPRSVRLAGSAPPGDAAWARLARVGLLALLALTAAWMLVSLWWPPGFDHGLYLWTADVVLRGGMVYADAWDMHGPLAAYLYALPQLLAGQRFWGVRLLDLAILGVSTYAMARVVARASAAPGAVVPGRMARGAGWWTAAVMVLAYASSESEYTAQPDGWVGLATAALLAAVALAPRPRLRHLALAGAAAGAFALLKPFYGLFVLVPLSYHAVHAGRAWRLSVRGVVVAGAASALVVGAMVAWFASRGALGALLEVHVRYTALTYNGGGLHVGERAAALVEFALRAEVLAMVFAAALAGAAALWRTGRRALLAALVVWIAVAVFCALLQNKYYRYHWLPAYPPILMLGAVGLAAAAAGRADAAGRTLALATALVITAHAATGPALFVARWASYAVGRTSPDAYYRTFADNSTSRPLEQMRVGRYLRERTPARSTVAVWGYDPGVLHHAQRPTPFRTAAWIWPVVLAHGSPVQQGYAAEYLRGLRERTPDYFVVNTRLPERRNHALRMHPEIAREVAARFVPDTTIGPFQVLRRREARP